MNSLLVKLIDDLDFDIKIFSKKFNIEMYDYNNGSTNKAYLCYERMLSIVSNNCLAKHLELMSDYQLLFYVSELPIKINSAFNENIDDLKNEVGYYKKTPTWDYCVVDGYFKLRQNENIYHAFIEYKLQNIFVYADLATDYLKYKLYTYEAKINSFFAYIIFNKDEDYPSIIDVSNKYCLLNKTISKGELENSKIYIYENNGVTEKDDNYEQLIKTSKIMDSFTKYGAELLKVRNDGVEELNDKSKMLLDILPKFNSKVVKSSLIYKNYNFISVLWNKSNEQEIFKGFLPNNENLDEIQKILLKGSNYNHFIDETITSEDRLIAETNGIRGSSYASLNLLALLDFFNQIFKIDSIKPNYGYKYIGKGRNKKLFNYQDTADNRIEKLFSYYGKKFNKETLKETCFALMYFIKNLYSILYDVDEINNQITGEKNISKLLKLEENIQETCNKVLKLIGYSHKINIKDLILQKTLDEALKELFYYIFSLYK